MAKPLRGSRDVVALVLAVGIALGLCLTLLLLSGGGSETVSGGGSSGPGGEVTEWSETSSESLLESEGPSVLIPLAIPVALPATALVARRRTVTLVAGWISLAFCLVAILSLGVFYLPVAILLLLAARWQRVETG